VQVGAESKVVFHSRYTMLRAYQVLVTGDGVTAEVQPPMLKPEEEAKKPELTKMEVKFTVAADALPGVRDVRIVTPTGVSTVGQVVIVRDPVIAEIAINDKPEQAQVVQFPATLCGGIEKAEDIDYFKFHAEAGQSFAFHVRCGRLEDTWIPIWDVSPRRRASSVRIRVSLSVLHKGFSTYTALPCFIASSATMQCM